MTVRGRMRNPGKIDTLSRGKELGQYVACEMWYDVSQMQVKAAGDLIATWSDLSGNSRDLLQATDGVKPLYYSYILHGHPGLYFQEDWMRSSAGMPSFPSLTVFIVCCLLNLISDNVGILSLVPPTGNDWNNEDGLAFPVHPTNYGIYSVRSLGANPLQINMFGIISRLSIITFKMTGGNALMRVNGAETSDTYSDTNPIDPGSILVNARAAPGVMAPGRATFGEIGIFSDAKSAGDITEIENNLKLKWNIEI